MVLFVLLNREGIPTLHGLRNNPPVNPVLLIHSTCSRHWRLATFFSNAPMGESLKGAILEIFNTHWLRTGPSPLLLPSVTVIGQILK